MLKKRVELLAPAGSYEAFLGAVNAGADAVYLAGNRFGARAYADNFSEDELKEAIFYAHIHDVKIYLTINTIFKNRELYELDDFLEPLYQAGLDGVIVQDLGVFYHVKKNYPGLELHVSTQMTVTSSEGAAFLRDAGADRIVPARELSLEETKLLCDEGIEVESFIHGSMCYGYSGQCLFSSLIGGRSGNRGRCAQPCRLPYVLQKDKTECYPLSLKDMCTLEILPELIESGIYSFKIEGRMKSPAYAAGVTSIYRKYIDLYFANPNAYKVEPEDYDFLRKLYIRTDIQTGYYHKNRHRKMVTLTSPSYSKTEETLADSLIERYCKNIKKLPVRGNVVLQTGKNCIFSLKCFYRGEEIEVMAEGNVVQEAIKSPLAEADILKRFRKCGDTLFSVDKMDVSLSSDAFMTVKDMNEVRRAAFEQLEILLRQKENEYYVNRCIKNERNTEYDSERTVSGSVAQFSGYRIFVEDLQQLKEVISFDGIEEIVLPLWLYASAEGFTCIKNSKHISFFIRMPAVCRGETFLQAEEILKNNMPEQVKGFYVNQIDSLAFIKKNFPGKVCRGDIHLYATNEKAIQALETYVESFTLSQELNKDELKHLPLQNGELMIYGRVPLLNSANCVFLTGKDCRKGDVKPAVTSLKDRKGAELPVRGYCKEAVCYNTIYNSVPTSLHKHQDFIGNLKVSGFQIRFTVEDASEVRKILGRFLNEKWGSAPEGSFTNGHFLRGIE